MLLKTKTLFLIFYESNLLESSGELTDAGFLLDFDVKQRIENIYERWISESMMKISDKPSNEDGETLERFYNRMNLDEKRCKILDDSKK